MGESTESSTECSPFTKPGFIILAALVIALLAGVVMIFLLPKGDRTTQRGRTLTEKRVRSDQLRKVSDRVVT
jgi:hypothetical protein